MAARTARKKRAEAVAFPVPNTTGAHIAKTPEWAWRSWWLFAGALLASLVAFGPALHGAFVFDDIHLPFADPNAASKTPAFWIGGVRPTLMATYWLNFLFSGTDPLSYHLVNIVLHALTALLVFRIIGSLFALSGFVHARSYALAGAAIFLLHPLQTESVDYVAGRSEVLSGLLFCGAWLLFLKSFAAEIRLGTSCLILLLGAAAVLAKENAICLPAVLLATDLFVAKIPFARMLKLRLKLYVPFLIGAAFASILILQTLTKGTGAGFGSGATPFEYALTQCKVLLLYIRLFFFPVGQNGDWQMPISRSLFDGEAAVYAIALLFLFVMIGWLWKWERFAALGLTLFLIMLAPTSSVVPIKDAMAERRLYMPIIGLILFSLVAVSRFHLSLLARRSLAIACVLVLALLSWKRSEVWEGPIQFWGNAALKNPANSRAHFGLGSALVLNNDCKGAVQQLTLARSGDPSNRKLLWNLASAYQCNKEPARALPLWRNIVELQPSADAWNHVGYNAAILGYSNESQAALDKAISLDPGNATAYAYRGHVLLAMQNVELAKANFQKALSLDPGNAIALEGMRQLPGN